MMFKVLASGSKGNCSFLKCHGLNLLIDVGINYKTLEVKLGEISVSPSDIDVILITHSHSDHIKGLSTLIKKTNKKIYIHETLVDDMLSFTDNNHIEIIGDSFEMEGVTIKLIPLSHDVVGFGFLIESDNKSIVYMTDTGYINKKYYDMLTNKTIYLIEANHDVEMLMNGPYPYYLKQRVVGDYGHLSNEACAKFLKRCIGKNTEYILLAHISENNNTKELAYKSIEKELVKIDFPKEKIIVTDQYESGEAIEV